MEHIDPLEELWAIKERLSEQFPTAGALAAEAARIAREEPLPAPGKNRKLIPGFPRGQSVADADPIMEEVYRIKEQLAREFGYDVHRVAEHLRARETALDTRHPAVGKPKQRKPSRHFRSTKPQSKHPRDTRS